MIGLCRVMAVLLTAKHGDSPPHSHAEHQRLILLAFLTFEDECGPSCLPNLYLTATLSHVYILMMDPRNSQLDLMLILIVFSSVIT